MNDRVRKALETDRVIDITTIGRRSGKPSKKEISFFNLDGLLYITGRPGRRDWYANLENNRRFVFHLKSSTKADIPARAIPIRNPGDRRDVIGRILGILGQWEHQLDTWIEESPLVQVHLEI